MELKNYTGGSKEFRNDTYIYDDNCVLKHNFSTNVFVHRSGERLYIPGIIMLNVSVTDYNVVNEWLSINIEPKKVTFRSQGSETSEELANCSAETIITAMLSYLDNFPSIKSEDVFEKYWKETEKDLKEAIDTLLNIWRDFDIDKAIEETEQRIQDVKNRLATKAQTCYADNQSHEGIPVPIVGEFSKISLDCDAQSEIDDLTDDLEALQMLKEEMTK